MLASRVQRVRVRLRGFNLHQNFAATFPWYVREARVDALLRVFLPSPQHFSYGLDVAAALQNIGEEKFRHASGIECKGNMFYAGMALR